VVGPAYHSVITSLWVVGHYDFLPKSETSNDKMSKFRLYVPRLENVHFLSMTWRLGLVVSSPPATEETGAMGREIESRQGIGW
jgi:hypothetical protein